MKPIITLVTVTVIYLVCPVVAHQQTVSARLLELGFIDDALVTETDRLASHTEGPYPRALVEQMAVVNKQISDPTEALGCLYEHEAIHACGALVLEEARLENRILAAELQ